MTIYTVHYYNVTGSAATVYLVGFYDNLEDAKARLAEFIPNYTEYVKDSVYGHGRVGWINCNTFGPLDSPLSASQPHSSVYLFE